MRKTRCVLDFISVSVNVPSSSGRGRSPQMFRLRQVGNDAHIVPKQQILTSYEPIHCPQTPNVYNGKLLFLYAERFGLCSLQVVSPSFSPEYAFCPVINIYYHTERKNTILLSHNPIFTAINPKIIVRILCTIYKNTFPLNLSLFSIFSRMY